MSLKRKNILGTPRESRVRQAFRSPFRSPVPSGSPIEPDSISAKDKTSGDKDLDGYSNTFDNSRERTTVVEQDKSVTPSKLVFNKADLRHTTPQRIRTSDLRKKIFPQQFSTPFRSPSNTVKKQQVMPEEQLADLIKQEAELDREIESLRESGFEVEELQSHIKNLHRYNEIKDAAQLVLGRLAELEQVTLKEMHEKYKVPTGE